jgi:peptidoglycan hydrolase-like protein with peptidoglycan-binding domain
MRKTLALAFLAALLAPAAVQAADREAPSGSSPIVRAAQARLQELGYLAGPVDGIEGPMTRNAILAFQGWRGLERTGRTSSVLVDQLETARRPVAAPGPARRIDVDLRRQVALLVEGGRVTRALHVSTGAPATPTPRGTYRVFRKETRSWSVPFSQWLPWASYFNRGIAFHESPEVPAYAASHGCVRVPAHEAPAVYAFARLGTVVRVL